MSRQISELEGLLGQLIVEHRKLLGQLEAQLAAMKALDMKAIDAAVNQQEASRLRIATLENRRRMLVGQIAKLMRIQHGPVTVQRLAELHPPRKDVLLKLRSELREVIGQISTRTTVVSRLAGAVLGHLNTVVRLMAGAVEQAGVYTKQGVPRVAPRIGVMDAVG